MRRRYLVAYDVADAKRLKKTHRAMHGFGDPLQYSLFLCALSAVEKQLMIEKLHALLNLAHDRVMIVDLGTAGSANASEIELLGKQLEALRDGYGATIV